MRIFGREPVAIMAFIAVALKLSSAYGWDVDADTQAAIMVALSCIVAVVEAFVLKTGAAFAAIVNLGHAAIALFLALGLEMSATDQALWMAGIESFIALFLRREVTAPVQWLRIEQSSPLDRANTTRAA
ncbi:hypothetical protein [Streptomyces scabiei]|uniref:hypothetical protein n=1 Tax=Streptomyces scabiei TaxID=1930 RepID=UPI000765D26A|nr:hypothetical protein [Streptomyces scabiei]MDX2658350.1 hypothetical protein [Streptomyces scabiei]MDX2870506.1 hypothetical protein [Streptomyces scabiei]MDX2996637.1 hypothetical protein [Streptomyces scabiei]MDX3048721.1 hypothetical protein [Streptomyces scabiei]